jgi:hypothetical protein
MIYQSYMEWVSEDELIEWCQEVITDPVILSSVFVLPEHFAVDMHGRVGWLPGPTHLGILMVHTHHIQQVRGHVKAWELVGSGLLDGL